MGDLSLSCLPNTEMVFLMDPLLSLTESLLAYLISLAAGLRGSAISEVGQKNIEKELKNISQKTKDRQLSQSFEERLELIPVKVSQLKNRLNDAFTEGPVSKLCVDIAFQKQIAQYLAANDSATHGRLYTALNETVERRFADAGATAEQAKSNAEHFFNMIQSSVFADPALSNYLTHQSLKYVSEQFDHQRKLLERHDHKLDSVIQNQSNYEEESRDSDLLEDKTEEARHIIQTVRAPVGVIGNGTHIEGGVHIHYDGSVDESSDKNASPKAEATPTSFSDLDPLLEAYGARARSVYEHLPLVGFRTRLRVPILIEDIYVPLRAILDKRITGDACFADAEDAEKNLMRSANAFKKMDLPDAFKQVENSKRRGIVILGDPGSGKTTHLKRVLLWCLQDGYRKLGLSQDMLPIFLPLRELGNLSLDLGSFIQAQMGKLHLDLPETFGQQLLARGHLLLLLDGLDEVADMQQRYRVVRWIDESLRVYPTCRFVVTSRFAGYTRSAQLSEQFIVMYIQPFDFESVKTFVTNWYRIIETDLPADERDARVNVAANAQGLIDILATSEFRALKVFELTRNPLLLAIICLVHCGRGDLPKSRTGLYEECIDVLLELWRKIIDDDKRVNADTGKKILQPVALWLHEKEGRTRATAEELLPVIEPALRDANWPHGDAKEFLRIVRDESGLLTGWDHETYGFMHLGFQEYLAARHIKKKFEQMPSVLNDMVERFGHSWWQEVILLLTSENPYFFEEFLRVLIQSPNFTEQPELLKMCFEDAAERPLGPLLDLLKTDPGKDPQHWQRQLLALKLIERFDNIALDELVEGLAGHPFDQIQQRVIWRKTQANQTVIQAPRGGYELVWIPGGEFPMGFNEPDEMRIYWEGPQHSVRVQGFFMGRFPVTNKEYNQFISENPKVSTPNSWGVRQFSGDRHPVVGVSWDDAQRYAEWAGLQLPNEAQWEYACRAGTSTHFYNGNSEKDLDRAGWYVYNSGGDIHPVGEKEPNAFGLYDMHGNIWEWVEDDWHHNYIGAPEDGRAWVDQPRGPYRVARGGDWSSFDRDCRASYREQFDPDSQIENLGFRLVLFPDQPK